MPSTELFDLVRSYQASGEGRDLVWARVAALVYERHHRYGFDDEDDAANALLKFRGRIAKAVDRFEDRGVPFDAYLGANLRYLARTVRRERRRARDKESICERASMSEQARGGTDADAAESGAALASMEALDCLRAVAARRPRARGRVLPPCPSEAAAFSSRLVFLAIKCAWEIDEAGIARVAASAGVDREWLASAIEQGRRSLEREQVRLDRLVERRNGSWTRLRLLEASVVQETDPYRRAQLEAAKGREEHRHERAREELGGQRMIVPNSVVARILGIPKGTVDSGLYYLRKRYGSE